MSHYSEDGFWLALDAINHYKVIKREKQRFYTIINTLLKFREWDEDWIMYKIACMMFINTLISAPPDKATRKQLKREFKDLHMLHIVDQLKQDDIDDTLMIQLGVFDEEMDDLNDDALDDEEEELNMDSLENPMEILKLIRVQLSGSDAFDHFVNILQYFLIISGKSTDEEKTENMSTLENIIKKAISTNEDGSIAEISVKELQLNDRVANQQKKISLLETQLGRLADMIKTGKIDQKMIEQLSSQFSQNNKERRRQMAIMDDPELEKAVMEETQALLQKMKPSDIDIENMTPDEYKKHVKNLEVCCLCMICIFAIPPI